MSLDSRVQLSDMDDTERLKMFVSGVADYAIYMLTPEGYIKSWNAGAQRFKGYTADEIIGQHFSRFYTEEDRASGLPSRALKIATEEGRFESEGWRVRKDGTRFWAHVVIDPIRTEQGELIGFAKITRDITERRDAAIALERAKEALFQSQKLEAIGQLTGGVAHDFNNLLGVIVTGIELLSADANNSPSSAKILDSMLRAATRGATLTQQLLSFARKQPLRQSRHDINRVINSFEAVLRRASNESIVFELNLAPALAPVMIDSAQFEAALLNLVSNARDAMHDGGTLTITTDNVDLRDEQVKGLKAGRYVMVMVSDTGSGMSDEVLARAIEPFFTTKEPGKGTGMGLSQVYGLVQQSGGDIVLSTRLGKGTSVSMYLPAMEGATDEAGRPEAPPGGDTALIVDDEPNVLEVTIELFRAMGYNVLSASNGKDAIEILKRSPDVGVLFTDVRMPGMSGVVLAREARQLIPSIKVVLASGYPAQSLSDDHPDFGEFAFVSKPYRTAEIMKLLRKAA
jgi:PAS domain S-box-containing protein